MLAPYRAAVIRPPDLQTLARRTVLSSHLRRVLYAAQAQHRTIPVSKGSEGAGTACRRVWNGTVLSQHCCGMMIMCAHHY